MTSLFARRGFVAGFIAIATLLPALALAHPGHDTSGALAGVLHPFTGLDHLLAMIAVGLWAAQLGRRAVWTLPIVFPAAMVVGALLAIEGIALPAIEPMIAISAMVLGVFVAVGVRMPVIASATLVAAFALFHGYAHASEAPASPTMIPYAFGFLSATVVLHLIGVAVGAWLSRTEADGRALKMVGSVIAAAGAAILFI